MRSLARIALDRLLALHPHFDVLKVEWQTDGPWLLVDLGRPSEGPPEAFAVTAWAIWKATGSVYGIRDGAVMDEPFLSL